MPQFKQQHACLVVDVDDWMHPPRSLMDAGKSQEITSKILESKRTWDSTWEVWNLKTHMMCWSWCCWIGGEAMLQHGLGKHGGGPVVCLKLMTLMMAFTQALWEKNMEDSWLLCCAKAWICRISCAWRYNALDWKQIIVFSPQKNNRPLGLKYQNLNPFQQAASVRCGLTWTYFVHVFLHSHHHADVKQNGTESMVPICFSSSFHDKFATHKETI